MEISFDRCERKSVALRGSFASGHACVDVLFDAAK
jgi:hypothetical protein